jgi:hypothetical protein
MLDFFHFGKVMQDSEEMWNILFYVILGLMASLMIFVLTVMCK